MCGIAGSLWFAPRDRASLEAEAAAMAGTLRHRGPDGAGTWVDPEAGLSFGHRRLAVMDVTPDGAQPMVSRDGRWVLNYNGEIYNHRQMRRRLEERGAAFRGQSDTEVFVEAVAAWGLDAALAAANGMFALALWDRHERRLHLVRDRMGEKPLYYGLVSGRFVFGSELRALLAAGLDGRLDDDAILAYLRHGCVPAPLSVYAGIRKLRPGEMLEVAWTGRGRIDEPRRFWDLRLEVQQALASPVTSEAEALHELEVLLRRSVAARMVADVPVGALLSGGVDSSLVVALMQQQSVEPVRTFTIGMEDPRYDESAWARAIAAHLGTAHTEMTVTATEALEVIPSMAQVYDEPFGDSSQIPTCIVAALARRSVTVALTGDGGDELFTGYTRHLLGDGLWRSTRRLPALVRAPLGRALGRIDPPRWDEALAGMGAMVPRRLRVDRPGHKLRRLGTVLEAATVEDAYLRLLSLWPQPESLWQGTPREQAGWRFGPDWLADAGLADRLTAFDAAHYLPDDLLVKVDRAAMAVSLEPRLPLLDHEVACYAWRMPQSMKVRDGVGKWPLRQLLLRHLPSALVDRPKTGFAIPVGEWLRGPLREWGSDLLTRERLDALGLRPQAVQAAWEAHTAGAADLTGELWAVLMLAAWTDSAPSASQAVARASS